MDEEIIQFYADNYCPKEFYKTGRDFKTCGHEYDRETACIKCWKRAIEDYGGKIPEQANS